MSEIVLETSNLSIGYNPSRQPVKVVAKDISLSLRAGELVCLLGPNGAGKSTLIRTLCGMRSPLSGHVKLMGEDISRLKPKEMARRLGVVLTDRIEVGMLSVYALVALGRHPHTGWTGTLSPRDERIVRWAIEIVGATALAKRRVNELSDGERQKVLIARALAQEPGLIVLDEPTAFLDLPRRVDIMSTLRRLAHLTNRAVLLSTHDLDLAMRSADRVWLLPPNGALQEGAPEDLVLSGAFEHTFHSEGVVFDSNSGSFKINDTPCGPIDLLGEGLTTVWTARALERIGYWVNQGGIGVSPASVEVLSDYRWQLVAGELRHTFTSLYDLVTYLQQPHPRPVVEKVQCH